MLNKVLNRRGLELRTCGRTIASLKSYPRLPTSGWIVEMIGTQAVGKSTLNNAVYKSLRSRWFFRHDLQYTGPTQVHSDDMEELHRRVYFRRLDHISESGLDAWKSITTCRQMAVVISESLIISSNTFPRGFILNDSLFKNFPREILELDCEEAAPLWRNRAFIYLRARDPDLAVSRFQRRAAERRKRGLFQHPHSDEEVRCRIETDNQLFDRIHGTALSFGSPSITVYAEDDLQCTTRNILDFEKRLN